MAEVHINSDQITDLENTPVTKVNVNVAGGVLREATGHLTTNSDDSIGSTYRLCRVPSHARVSQVIGMHDVGSATAGAGDIGLYDTAENGDAVVDADFFASAWDFNAAGDTGFVDLTHEAAAGASYLVNESDQRIWEILGLDEDPGKDYDVAITLTEAVATAACVVGVKVRYVTD